MLVDKICEVCGNPFQVFEVVGSAKNKCLKLTTCETCSYYIKPHCMEVDDENIDSRRFYCEECPKSFTRKDKLDRHKATHSELRPFCCKVCEKTFKRSDKLVEHMKAIHPDELVENRNLEVTCEVCGSADGVISVKIDETEGSFLNICEICNMTRQEGITDSIVNDTKLFQCDLCLRYFSRKDHATRHRLTHLDLKPFECHICQKSFNRNDRLLRHMRTHPNAKPFSCKLCYQAFAFRDELKNHTNLIHPRKKIKGQVCELCQKTFRDKEKLKRHLVTHMDYKPYCCELCGKMFKLLDSLLLHRQVHSDYKPHKCETCGLAFKLKETYRRHLLVHTNITKYTCNVCSKSFKRRDKLKAHSIVHVDLKPFQCELCSSGFKRRDKFNRHCKNVHGVDPHSMRLANGMKMEIKQELQLELNIACDMCTKSFDCEDDLTEHKLVHYR